jgi:hypothetical protein
VLTKLALNDSHDVKIFNGSDITKSNLSFFLTKMLYLKWDGLRRNRELEREKYRTERDQKFDREEKEG